MSEQAVGRPMKGAVATLAFRVVPNGDNLFSAEMLLIKGATVAKVRTGLGTLMGHAIAQADNLLDGFALTEIETSAEKYFDEVQLL